jgi:hypothetical protein
VDLWIAAAAVAAAFFAVHVHRPTPALAHSPIPREIDETLGYVSKTAFGRSGEVKLLFSMPGQAIDLPVQLTAGDSIATSYEWTSLRGIETRFASRPVVGDSGVAPKEPGFYYLTLVRGQSRQILTEPVLAVLRPFDEKSGTVLNGYRIGTYIAERLRGKRKECPEGFLEVYPQHLDLPISKHLRVRDFITHDDQANVWPKYVVLSPRLLDKLELVFAELAKQRSESAMSADMNLDVHSGFRTPSHNKRLRRAARDSRHQYGDAADISVDANWNGRIDRTDWRVLVSAVEAVERSHPDLVGGLGIYNSRRVSSPYFHIDVRGKRSRWKG